MQITIQQLYIGVITDKFFDKKSYSYDGKQTRDVRQEKIKKNKLNSSLLIVYLYKCLITDALYGIKEKLQRTKTRYL